MECRETDYEHYIKCGKCGWEGWSAWMRHGYQSYGFGGLGEAEPVDFCPECDTSEIFAELFLICHRRCNVCPDRYLCYTVLNNIPKNKIGFYSRGDKWLKI